MRWSPVLLFSALFLVAPPAQGGILVSNPGPNKLHGANAAHWTAQGRVIALRWIAPGGRPTTQRLPSPIDPFQPGALVAPPGVWTDVVLVLDGPVRLEGERFIATLDLGEWTIPLEDPTVSTERPLVLDLALPLDLTGSVGPDHPGYAALLGAARDGALAR